jgi:hypothetical protein
MPTSAAKEMGHPSAGDFVAEEAKRVIDEKTPNGYVHWAKEAIEMELIECVDEETSTFGNWHQAPAAASPLRNQNEDFRGNAPAPVPHAEPRRLGSEHTQTWWLLLVRQYRGKKSTDASTGSLQVYLAGLTTTRCDNQLQACEPRLSLDTADRQLSDKTTAYEDGVIEFLPQGKKTTAISVSNIRGQYKPLWIIFAYGNVNGVAGLHARTVRVTSQYTVNNGMSTLNFRPKVGSNQLFPIGASYANYDAANYVKSTTLNNSRVLVAFVASVPSTPSVRKQMKLMAIADVQFSTWRNATFSDVGVLEERDTNDPKEMEIHSLAAMSTRDVGIAHWTRGQDTEGLFIDLILHSGSLSSAPVVNPYFNSHLFFEPTSPGVKLDNAWIRIFDLQSVQCHHGMELSPSSVWSLDVSMVSMRKAGGYVNGPSAVKCPGGDINLQLLINPMPGTMTNPVPQAIKAETFIAENGPLGCQKHKDIATIEAGGAVLGYCNPPVDTVDFRFDAMASPAPAWGAMRKPVPKRSDCFKSWKESREDGPMEMTNQIVRTLSAGGTSKASAEGIILYDYWTEEIVELGYALCQPGQTTTYKSKGGTLSFDVTLPVVLYGANEITFPGICATKSPTMTGDVKFHCKAGTNESDMNTITAPS